MAKEDSCDGPSERTAGPFFALWGMLLGFWLVLSGMFDAFHVGAGVLCTLGVTFLTYDLQLVSRGTPDGGRFHLATLPWHRVVAYAAWLLREIAVANWQVAKIVLSPKLPIDPALIRFHSSLRSDLGVTALANSITLTPGTITVQAENGEFLIHALVGGEPVVTGVSNMQRRIVRALPGIESAEESAE